LHGTNDGGARSGRTKSGRDEQAESKEGGSGLIDESEPESNQTKELKTACPADPQTFTLTQRETKATVWVLNLFSLKRPSYFAYRFAFRLFIVTLLHELASVDA
jgi:hypothetical protein